MNDTDYHQSLVIGTHKKTNISVDNLLIRVVCASKGPAQNFSSATMLGRSLVACHLIKDCELYLIADNQQGLSTIYNQAIEQSKHEPKILVFVHDDVLITDYHWQQRVREGLKKFDIVGVAGNTQRLPNQPGWIIEDKTMKLASTHVLSGAIGQGSVFPPPKVDVFGPIGLECKLLDGVFLAVRSDRLHETGLRFDSQFAFHFYDLDFCRSAEQLNMRMGTIDVSLVHASLGTLDQSWLLNYEKYIKKWGD